MKYYYLDLYDGFSCLAGRCPSTCCAGWKIAIDKESYERFARLDNIPLREDILSHIYQQKGEYRFINRQDGRCSMLDEDGLCRIQRNLDEKSLCYTCRKFPRLTAVVGEDVWMSMAASCPVVADYLWNGQVGWMEKDASALSVSVVKTPFPVVTEGMERYLSRKKNILAKKKEQSDLPEQQRAMCYVKRQCKRFELELDLVVQCLDLMTEFPERPYLKGSFDYFEREGQNVVQIAEDMERFESEWQEPYMGFVDNYLPYRLFSRYLEEQKEEPVQRYCQVMGELTMLYVILFSRFCTFGTLTQQDVIESINWVYRFCAHGKKLSEKVHKMFCEVYPSLDYFEEVLSGGFVQFQNSYF